MDRLVYGGEKWRGGVNGSGRYERLDDIRSRTDFLSVCYLLFLFWFLLFLFGIAD